MTKFLNTGKIKTTKRFFKVKFFKTINFVLIFFQTRYCATRNSEERSEDPFNVRNRMAKLGSATVGGMGALYATRSRAACIVIQKTNNPNNPNNNNYRPAFNSNLQHCREQYANRSTRLNVILKFIRKTDLSCVLFTLKRI